MCLQKSCVQEIFWSFYLSHPIHYIMPKKESRFVFFCVDDDFIYILFYCCFLVFIGRLFVEALRQRTMQEQVGAFPSVCGVASCTSHWNICWIWSPRPSRVTVTNSRCTLSTMLSMSVLCQQTRPRRIWSSLICIVVVVVAHQNKNIVEYILYYNVSIWTFISCISAKCIHIFYQISIS